MEHLARCRFGGVLFLVAVDPGKRKVGVSVWCLREQRLVAATCVRSTPQGMAKAVLRWADKHTKRHSRRWVIEKMQDYRRGRQHADGIDDVTAMSDALVRLLGEGAAIQWLYPREWKGNVPKDVHHRRIKKLLLPIELRLAGAYQHDKFDAIALGMTAIKRCDRGGQKCK